MNGMATLKYRKNFVASLHNATELFIKQFMFDIGDRGVCKRISARRNPDGALRAKYDAATDLNAFFRVCRRRMRKSIVQKTIMLSAE